MSKSTKPVRVSKRSQLLGCAFILQAAAIAACASDSDPAEGTMTGTMTSTPSQTAGSPATTTAGTSAASAGSAAAAAGRPATGTAGTPGAATGTAGSTAAAAGSSAGAAGSSAGAAGSSAGAAGSSAGAAGSGSDPAASGGEAGSSGGAAGGGATAGGATFTQVFDAMFASSAAVGCGACHGTGPNPNLNGGLGGLMTKEAAYEALVGKTSSSAMCSGETYVKAGDPEGSLLYQKVAAAPMCGMRMPPGGMVPASDVELLKNWIMAGAMND